MSIYGRAFDALDESVKKGITRGMQLRRKNYQAGCSGVRSAAVKVILVGDRPGNGAKLLPTNHHHTPFFSTKNSSLWLNRQLYELGVHEDSLFWINAYDMYGVPSSYDHLRGWNNPMIVALGGNAEKWLKQGGFAYEKVYHPQAWKRFKSVEPYPLLDLLRQQLDLQTSAGPPYLRLKLHLHNR